MPSPTTARIRLEGDQKSSSRAAAEELVAEGRSVTVDEAIAQGFQDGRQADRGTVISKPMSDQLAHYRVRDIEARLLAAIESAGLDPRGGFGAEALGTLDHFHTGGRRATLELLELVRIASDDYVVDIGAGIGGPARMIAATHGCRVACVEPSEEFCRAARLLNRLTALEGQVEVHHATALALPFAEQTFGLAWMQNVGMNIPDKSGLYREIARVLKPGGRFAFQEGAAGESGEPHFPVPWATEAAENHLARPEEIRAALTAAGFEAEKFEDMSATELSRPPAGAAQGPLTIGVYIPDATTRLANVRRSLEEGRIAMVRGVFRKS